MGYVKGVNREEFNVDKSVLKRIAKEKGLTITNISKKIGYSQSALSQIINYGKTISPDDKETILKLLDCTYDDLKLTDKKVDLKLMIEPMCECEKDLTPEEQIITLLCMLNDRMAILLNNLGVKDIEL